MEVWIVILLLLFVISLIGIWYVLVYNKFQTILIKITEISVNLDTLLKSEYDLLNRLVEIIKTNLKTKEAMFEDLEKIKIESLTTYALDEALNSSINEVYKLKEKYPDLKTSDTFNTIDHDLLDIEEQLVGLRKFYNDNITEYNYLLKKFPSNIIALTSKLKQKTFYNEKANEN